MRKPNEYFILRGDNFVLQFSKYFSKQNEFIRERLNKKVKRLKKEDYSYRIINHWEAKGLIDSERDNETGWRKFGLIDLVWINIIKELRQFGVSIEDIGKVKKHIMFSYKKKDISHYRVLEFYVARFLVTKEPTYLLVFSNFDIELAVESELKTAEYLNTLGNYLRIRIHAIVQRILPQKDLTPMQEHNLDLEDSEHALILTIRTGAFKEIIIKMKNGKIRRIDKKVENPEKKLFKLLNQKNYDTITITRADGNILDIQQTILEKL